MSIVSLIYRSKGNFLFAHPFYKKNYYCDARHGNFMKFIADFLILICHFFFKLKTVDFIS